MATALDTITRALRLVQVIEAGEIAEAEDAVDGLSALNEMVYGWELFGINIGWQTVTQSQELCVHDKYLEGIRYNLAIRLAAEWEGVDAPATVIAIALSTFKALQLNTLEFEDDMKIDRVLHPRFFTRRVGAYNIDEG